MSAEREMAIGHFQHAARYAAGEPFVRTNLHEAYDMKLRMDGRQAREADNDCDKEAE
jgi:hypothetical protein